jgi:transposase InsO family protein
MATGGWAPSSGTRAWSELEESPSPHARARSSAEASPTVCHHSDHDAPIFPNLASDVVITGPNQLWVADITYIAIAAGFVYLAAILDAWSRRVVGYAISRSIDARLALVATENLIRAGARRSIG